MTARRKLSADERLSRAAARLAIVQAVNRHRVRFHAWHPHGVRLFDLRQIQLAVRIARHNHLVKPSVLEAAGFRPGS